MRRSNDTLKPRNGHTLVVGIVARISGGPNQKELSLQDQEDHAKQVVQEMYEGPVDYRTIATTAKGERLDRPELLEIEKWIRSGELDLLIAEDLGRIVRGTEAVVLCGLAEDHGTRVIAPNDCVDTADESWEADVISACRDHVGHNSHTSKRLKKKLLNRFEKFGGAMARPIYGYHVSKEAKTYFDWKIDEQATPIYREWFERLRQNPNCSSLADWLNSKGIRPGPYARNLKWDGRMVRRITSNPILKGYPGRGFKKSIKHHESGRRISVRNPDGAVFIHVPQLAHVTPEIWEEVNRLLEQSNQGCGRKPIHGADPRARTPKKRTAWPGQHVRCGICNRLIYWGGHGQQSHMMCSGNRDYKCWNGVTFDGHVARQKILAAIVLEIMSMPEFDEVFLDKIRTRVQERQSTVSTDRRQAEQELVSVQKQLENVINAIAETGLTQPLKHKLDELQTKERSIRFRLQQLNRQPSVEIAIPTVAQLRHLVSKTIDEAMSDQEQLGQFMRTLITDFRVYPVRLCDGGGLVMRGEITIDFARLLPDLDHHEAASPLMRRELTINLFELPQRAAYREQVAQMREQGLTERDIAERLGLTITTTQRAFALYKMMRAQGLSDPYIKVTEPPSDCTKMRRHLHPRYRFEVEGNNEAT